MVLSRILLANKNRDKILHSKSLSTHPGLQALYYVWTRREREREREGGRERERERERERITNHR